MSLRPYNFIILLVLTSVAALAQSKYDKMISKAEASYAIGDYAKASKFLAKFDKKATKKLGKQNEYTPKYNLLLAKYNFASGLVLDFESDLEKAISSSVSINQPNSKKHGLLLMDVADLQIMNGAYLAAAGSLEESKKVLDAGSFMDSEIEAKWSIKRAEVLSGQGYFNEAISLIRENEQFFAGRALKQETYVDDNGNLKSRKLDGPEIEERFNEYAHLLTLLANTYGSKEIFAAQIQHLPLPLQWIDKKS